MPTEEQNQQIANMLAAARAQLATARLEVAKARRAGLTDLANTEEAKLNEAEKKIIQMETVYRPGAK